MGGILVPFWLPRWSQVGAFSFRKRARKRALKKKMTGIFGPVLRNARGPWGGKRRGQETSLFPILPFSCAFRGILKLSRNIWKRDSTKIDSESLAPVLGLTRADPPLKGRAADRLPLGGTPPPARLFTFGDFSFGDFGQGLCGFWGRAFVLHRCRRLWQALPTTKQSKEKQIKA